MKIDVFTHVLPKAYDEAVHRRIARDKLIDARGTERAVGHVSRSVWDMDFRCSIMDRYEGLVHVLTPTNRPLELIASPADAAYLARIYNDEMAKLVAKYPQRFVAAVAILPMNNVAAALSEIDRAIGQLGLKGILIHTPVYDQSLERWKPMDAPEFIPIYERMAHHDLPIWIHPRREPSRADFTNVDWPGYAINHIFGWPYETTVAMARLVFSGILEKYPSLKFITHHCGAMVPYFADRIIGAQGFWETTYGVKFAENLTRPPIEYFRMFYNDTAIYGNTPALMNGYAFFGVEHLLFGTDFPFDDASGDTFTRDTIAAVQRMNIPAADMDSIFLGNARRLLKLERVMNLR